MAVAGIAPGLELVVVVVIRRGKGPSLGLIHGQSPGELVFAEVPVPACGVLDPAHPFTAGTHTPVRWLLMKRGSIVPDVRSSKIHAKLPGQTFAIVMVEPKMVLHGVVNLEIGAIVDGHPIRFPVGKRCQNPFTRRHWCTSSRLTRGQLCPVTGNGPEGHLHSLA
jgi:hypothetical protein